MFQGYKVPREYCEETGKLCYDKRSAITAKNKRYKEDRINLREYECEHCGCWHLTKVPLHRYNDW